MTDKFTDAAVEYFSRHLFQRLMDDSEWDRAKEAYSDGKLTKEELRAIAARHLGREVPK